MKGMNPLVQEIMEQRNTERIEHEEHIKRHNSDMENDKVQILLILGSHGIPPATVHTNGYWYKFKYKQMSVSFVNQETRICADWYIDTGNEEEMRFFHDEGRFLEHKLSPEKYAEFQKHYNSGDAIFECAKGSVGSAVTRLLHHIS